jgi:hypothetical protein
MDILPLCHGAASLGRTIIITSQAKLYAAGSPKPLQS